jgi:hypothetical protein
MPSISEAAPSLQPTTVRSDTRIRTLQQETRQTLRSVHASQNRSAPIPWWLWWNVLSLDAPAVACVWSVLLLRANGFTTHFAEIVALVVAVWSIYTIDRLLDGLTSSTSSLLQTRHSFAAKHRFLFTVFTVFAVFALLWISMERLEASTVRAGLILGVIVAFYLASIHAGSSRLSPSNLAKLLPKEISVGMIFAAGTSVPLWSRSERFTIYSVVVWLLFGFLCSLNCLSIECWERPRDGREQREVLVPWIAWADSHLDHAALGLAFVAFFAGCLSGSRDFSRLPLPAISLAAFLTMILNSQRRRLSPEVFRVLADAALVIPALAALTFLY